MVGRSDGIKPLLLVRADASPLIGVGHVMRCMALGQAWTDAGGTVMFACRELPDAVASRLESEGIITIFRFDSPVGSEADAQALLSLTHHLSPAWVVTDGYRFRVPYHQRLSAAGVRTAIIDDKGDLEQYAADLVLNQNLHADTISYASRAPGTRLLLGPRYALLRREFRYYDGPPRTYSKLASKLLVLLGGSDPRDHTTDILERLLATDFDVTAVIGPANPRAEAVRARFSDRARVLLDQHDVTPLIREADLAVSSGGSAVWEMARFGTPMILGAIVDVEELLAGYLAQAGGCLYVGLFDILDLNNLVEEVDRLAGDVGLRTRLGQTSAALIDGQGATRVAAEMWTQQASKVQAQYRGKN